MPAFYGLGFGLLMLTAGQHVDSVLTVLPEGVRDGMILAAARNPDGWWKDRPEP